VIKKANLFSVSVVFDAWTTELALKENKERIYLELAERLRRLRKMHGWSQSEIASKLGWTNTSYSDIEGFRKKCDLNSLVELAELYQLNPDFLITGNRDQLSAEMIAKMEKSLEWMHW
jgi:transcriptional regulator with XRE-family HTH domain